MNIVLCHPYDRDAVWLALQLRAAGKEVLLLSPEELMMAKKWSQNINTASDDFLIELHSGTVIRSGEIQFMFNRTMMAGSPLWKHAHQAEQEYVRSEMAALFLAWLYQLQERTMMMNPPMRYSLSGAMMTAPEWHKAANDAGFDIVNSPNETQNILVVGTKVLTNIKRKEAASKALALSRMVQSPILEISTTHNGAAFVSASAAPPLSKYGQNLVRMIIGQIPEMEDKQ